MGKLTIANEYINSPAYMVDAVPAFKALAEECEQLITRLAHFGLPTGAPINIMRVPESEPYPTAEEMFQDINRGQFLVSSLNCRHPQWSMDINIMFRVVHDILGHYMVESGFSWQGELAAYQSQAKWHSPLACEALFTEVVGQTACYSVNREFPAQKVILLEARHDSIDLL